MSSLYPLQIKELSLSHYGNNNLKRLANVEQKDIKVKGIVVATSFTSDGGDPTGNPRLPAGRESEFPE